MEKKYDHQIQEPRLKKLWHDQAVYQLTRQELDARPLFSIDTPPPTVSGSLHIGHIFSYTHTDLIARYKRMNGHAVFYPFGFDGNGLPTERFVESFACKKQLMLKKNFRNFLSQWAFLLIGTMSIQP